MSKLLRLLICLIMLPSRKVLSIFIPIISVRKFKFLCTPTNTGYYCLFGSSATSTQATVDSYCCCPATTPFSSANHPLIFFWNHTSQTLSFSLRAPTRINPWTFPGILKKSSFLPSSFLNRWDVSLKLLETTWRGPAWEWSLHKRKRLRDEETSDRILGNITWEFSWL